MHGTVRENHNDYEVSKGSELFLFGNVRDSKEALSVKIMVSEQSLAPEIVDSVPLNKWRDWETNAVN